MPLQTTTLSVLIASPGDTQRERGAVEEAILAWNSDHTANRKVHLLPLRWELDATPALGGTAQAMINAQFADRADIVIGLFYSRLGQPTADAPSGTAEEIERAIQRGATVGVWCSTAPLPRDVDTDQLAALRQFQTALQSRGLLGSFASPEDLKAQVRSFLERAVHELVTPTRDDTEGSGASGAVLRGEFLSDREPRVTQNGRVTTRRTRERLRISNIGTKPANDVKMHVEPLGDGESPLLREDPGVERLLHESYFDIPLALTFGTSPQARITLSWTEGGREFSETQVVRWM